MITPMQRVHIAARDADRERVLSVLAELGVLHVVPAQPTRAVPERRLTAALDEVGRALQIAAAAASAGTSAGSSAGTSTATSTPTSTGSSAGSSTGTLAGSYRSTPPDVTPAAAVKELIALRAAAREREVRLAALHRQLEQAATTGYAPPAQLAGLEAAGAPVRLFAVLDDDVARVSADLVQPLGRFDGEHVLLAVVGAKDHCALPDGARPVALPAFDAAAVRAEAAALVEAGARDARRTAELALLMPGLKELRARLQAASAWSVARRSVLHAGGLCAFDGWIPADQAGTVTAAVQATGIDAAVHFTEPTPEDAPPTLIRYAAWTRPVRGLFDMLGTTPGYRETDMSAFFMIALPLFAGMIIGDAGYGLLFVLLPLLARRRLVAALGTPRTQLLLTFGTTALLWGALVGAWFGVTPGAMIAAGGAPAVLGDALYRVQLLRGSEEVMRATLIKLCFVIGGVHLIAAHARRALALAPAQRALAEVGWCLVLAAMVGVIWTLFFGAAGDVPAVLRLAVPVGLATGLPLVVAFGAPHRNPVRRFGLGIAGSLLPLLGTFSDTLSYIRLMAVGLASQYIAAAFNTLAASVAGSATWFAGAPVLLVGHLLNIGLIFIAIFAHGVRLNMLEFSSNAGVQWSGYPYRPFHPEPVKET
jgi:V/A-type H+/Na+-transporting ATPase subunit I